MRPLTVHEFGRWFHLNHARLRNAPCEDAAEEIGEQLLRVDNRLGIEIADSDVGDGREAIVTAFSNAKAFELVYELTREIREALGWKFIALKPPRGFDFKLTVNTRELSAETIMFCPHSTVVNGFQLLVPNDIAQQLENSGDAEEIAWLIVESGIGEAAASRIQHLEFSEIESAAVKHPISQLQFAVSTGFA